MHAVNNFADLTYTYMSICKHEYTTVYIVGVALVYILQALKKKKALNSHYLQHDSITDDRLLSHCFLWKKERAIRRRKSHSRVKRNAWVSLAQPPLSAAGKLRHARWLVTGGFKFLPGNNIWLSRLQTSALDIPQPTEERNCGFNMK